MRRVREIGNLLAAKWTMIMGPSVVENLALGWIEGLASIQL
jgi:hypothetical protein